MEITEDMTIMKHEFTREAKVVLIAVESRELDMFTQRRQPVLMDPTAISLSICSIRPACIDNIVLTENVR